MDWLNSEVLKNDWLKENFWNGLSSETVSGLCSKLADSFSVIDGINLAVKLDGLSLIQPTLRIIAEWFAANGRFTNNVVQNLENDKSMDFIYKLNKTAFTFNKDYNSFLDFAILLNQSIVKSARSDAFIQSCEEQLAFLSKRKEKKTQRDAKAYKLCEVFSSKIERAVNFLSRIFLSIKRIAIICFKNLFIFFAYIWELIKAQKKGACPYFTFDKNENPK